MSTPLNLSKKSTPSRVRFAPSPTGYLHIGSLRTALYNFLFARHSKGKFLIRIEDTDKKRRVKGATEKLLATLKEFNLESDEPVIIQSKRLKIYQKYADQLVKAGRAYYCFCTQERLEKMRKEQERKNQPPKYDGRCRNLGPLMTNDPSLITKVHVIRLKIPRAGETQFTDIIRGQVKFENKLIDDQILLKSDGYPTYHLANVVDDHEMKITHVIRGEEWVSSTPKHLQLYKCFGWQPPKFAHLPLLLNPDKSKLSKRQGDVAVEDYLKRGYLKDTLLNFIAFLGWNPGTEKEIYSLDELIHDFDLKKVQKAGAIFNLKKLDWLNGYYIRQLPIAELADLCLPYLVEVGLIENMKIQEYENNLHQIIKLAQDRLKRLDEIGKLVGFIFQDKLEYEPSLLIPKKSNKETTIKALEFAKLSIINYLSRVASRDQLSIIGNSQKLREKFDSDRKKYGLSRNDAFWPLRVAVSGQKNSPDVFEIITALGQEKSIQRIKHALKLLT